MAHDRVQQDFTELNNESYVIEQKLQEYYRNLGYIVIDRSQDKEYQEKDIDFDVISDVNTTLSVEVKADKVMYETGNIMVEHGHIRPSKVRTKEIVCFYQHGLLGQP